MTPWKKYRLGDVAEIIMGQSPKGDSCNKDVRGMPLLNGPTEFGLYYPIPVQYTIDPKKFSEKGDILFCVRGSTGRMNFADRKYAIGRGIAAIRGKQNNTKFCKYVIDYYLNDLLNITTGSTFPNLSKNDLNNFEINLPPLPEQRRIAEILGSLDDKIELNLEMNKTLEQMAMLLYKRWFVDFEFPDSEGKPYKSNGGEFVESELGLIPKGWEVKKLGEVVSIKHGFAFKGEYFTQNKNENVLLTPGNFKKEGGIKFDWGKQKFYTGEYPSEYILKKWDLLLAMTDLTQSCDILGSSAFVIDEKFKYLHNQRLGLIVSKEKSLKKSILYRFFNSDTFRSFVKGSKTGTTVSHTSPSRIYMCKIVFPPEYIQEKVDIIFQNIDNQIALNLIENQTLSEIRDTLLPKLISGEVRVKV
jgi:type I restriction enzyme S subunit